eukprot:scaffold168625_cov46-Attheya_sp.AAC.1
MAFWTSCEKCADCNRRQAVGGGWRRMLIIFLPTEYTPGATWSSFLLFRMAAFSSMGLAGTSNSMSSPKSRMASKSRSTGTTGSASVASKSLLASRAASAALDLT